MTRITAWELLSRYLEQEGIEAMIDKCANPECNERLVYLRSGVLYAVDTHRAATHFFWMCEACSSTYKLHFNSLGEPDVVSISVTTRPYGFEGSNCSVHSILINPPSHRMPKAIVTAGSEPQSAIPPVPGIREHQRVRRLPQVEQRACA